MNYEPHYIAYQFKDGVHELADVGRDGILIFKDAVFKGYFDENGGRNEWDRSSGKKILEKWFKDVAPYEFQERYDVDLPAVEEVFSQKMIDCDFGWWCGPNHGFVSNQFPIFKDSDERMKSYQGSLVWWWTKTPKPDKTTEVMVVRPFGDLYANYASNPQGYFVPVLRPKEKNEEMEECPSWN